MGTLEFGYWDKTDCSSEAVPRKGREDQWQWQLFQWVRFKGVSAGKANVERKPL